jgi:hypothetical protein
MSLTIRMMRTRDACGFPEYANSLQTHYRFTTEAGPADVQLAVRESAVPWLFAADRVSGIVVYRWEDDGLARYANLSGCEYLAVCSCLALVQWRALQSHALLMPEDFVHRTAGPCLFSRQRYRYEYAAALDGLTVCGACFGFYRCLGLDAELSVLRTVLGIVSRHRYAGPRQSMACCNCEGCSTTYRPRVLAG